MLAALPTIGPFELILVLAVLILLFGARKVPELARSIGQALGEFRHGTAEDEPDNHPPDPR